MHKPYNIFISYSTADEAFAQSLERSLRFRGFKTWFAPLTLQVGDKLLDSINAGLIASEFGLVVISPSYISKAWTSYELDILHRQHIESDKVRLTADRKERLITLCKSFGFDIEDSAFDAATIG